MNRHASPTALRPETATLTRHLLSHAVAASVAILFLCAQFACGGGSSTGAGGGATQRTFTTIDVDGAGTSNQQGTFALSINATGEVAGYFSDSNGLYHGFVRSAAGEVTTFDVPGSGGQGTLVNAINSAGDIVGFYDDPDGGSHSYVRTSDGTITTFDPPGSNNSIAESTNESGTVVGSSLGLFFSPQGYLRAQSGTITSFNAPGSPGQPEVFSQERINASGTVSGYFIDSGGVSHGFMRDPSGNLTVLDAPGAGTAAEEGTEIVDLNATGTTVGIIGVGVVNGVNATHAVVRNAAGAYTVFDPPQANGVSSAAYAINDSGTIVGTYRGSDLIRHAYLLQPNGSYVSFDDPQALVGPLTLSDLGTIPRGINSTGAVVGLYSDVNGVRHGFVWQ